MTREIETEKVMGRTSHLADTDEQHQGSEVKPAKFNRHLYLNFLTNLETQIEYWNRSAVRSPNPETAHALWLKAEGLEYALRLLYAFEPEFRELVECASKGTEFEVTVPTSQDHEGKSS